MGVRKIEDRGGARCKLMAAVGSSRMAASSAAYSGRGRRRDVA